MTPEQIQKLIQAEVTKALAGQSINPVQVLDFRRMAANPELRKAASRETVKNARRGIL